MQRRSTARPTVATRRAVPPPAAAGHRPLLIAVALATGFAPLVARSQPTGAQAIVGAASLSQQGNKLVVTTQNGAGGFSAINWQSFSVPGGTTTYFAQPGATSTSINRVVGTDPSAIFGTLGSNGRLVLVNPAGITVGAGAVVDTAGFTASTLRMSDADALAGRMRFDGSAGGMLQVDGQVLARSGDVVLIGSKVQTGAAAIVQSPQGATVLAAGQKVEVTGRGLEGIVFQVQAPTDQAVNLGTLQGDAVGVFAGTLKHSGLVQVQAVSTEGGRVVLKAADQAVVSGAVQAKGLAGAGGSVDVLGAKVGLVAGASIDTGNTQGGGQIRVGGDYQGGNAQLPNAQVTYVDGAAQLKASATDQGNGGKVIVWADDTTRMHGSITANAGPNGGDGGFVETSGKRALDARDARVAAGAPRGRAGTWLLDPDDLKIVGNPGPTPAPTAPPENYGGADPNFTPGLLPLESVIYDSTLNAALNGPNATNVEVKTGSLYTALGLGTGDIVFEGPVNLERTVGGSATLTLNAWNDIVFKGGSSVNFLAAAAPAATAPPVPSRLDVVLTAAGQITTELNASVTVGGATVDDQASLIVTGGKTWTHDGTLTLGTNGRLVLHDGTAAAVFANASAGTVAGNPGAGGGVGGPSPTQLGTFTNAGNVTLSSGTFSVASFSQGGGAANFSGSANLTVTNAFAVAGGSLGFTGDSLSLTQQTGDLALGSSGPAITASGSVALTANSGNVTIDRAVSAVGDMAIGAGSSTVPNGAVTLNAPVSADRLLLSAWGTDASGNSITQGAPITANELMVVSGGKAMLANGGNQVQALAASVESLDFVDKVDLLTIKPLSNPLATGTVAGLPYAGAIRITTNAATSTAGSGSVAIDPAATVVVESLAINAAGDIRADASIATFGKYDTSIPKLGDVDLSAGGAIKFTAINTYGGAIGTMGSAGGGVTLNAGTGVDGISIDTSGVPSTDNTVGNPGGAIGITSTTGNVVVKDLVRSSGQYAGGHGGNVSISAAAGSLSLGTVDVTGGDDGSGTGGGTSGAIQLNAGGAVSTGALQAYGGYSALAAGGSGGSVLVTAGSDIDINGWVDSSGNFGTAGGAGAAISLASAGGGVNVLYGISSSGGSGSAGAGGAGAAIRITSGGGTGISVGDAIAAAGGSGTTSAGAGGGVSLAATGGGLSLGGVDTRGGDASTGGGAAGGRVNLTASGAASIASIVINGGIQSDGGYGSNAGGSAGNVTVTGAGDVIVWGTSTETLNTNLASSSLYFGSAVSATGASGSLGPGGSGGVVTVSSGGGNVSLMGRVDTSAGSSSAANGGTGGAIGISAGGAVEVGPIDSSGGDSGFGAGGNAGAVAVDAGSGLGMSYTSARGGSGGGGATAGGRGGSGGAVTLKLASGDLRLDDVSIDAGGGMGGSHASVGGAGGTGGNIVLTASTGAVFMNAADPSVGTYGASISTEGGAGGDTTGVAATSRGGAGGAGGTLRIVAAADSGLLGTLASNGGAGGGAPGAGSLAVGGAGGSGGAISVTLTAPAATLALGGGVFASGGAGGLAADFDATLNDWVNVDPARAGTAGATSTFSASAPGGVLVRAAGELPTLAASSGDALASLNMEARWTHAGSLVLDPNAWVRITQPFTNSGTVKLGSGSLLSLGTYDQRLQTFTPGGVTFFNTATGLLQGGGTVQANVSNAGTLSPGEPGGGLGALTVAGDLALQSTGKLLLDAAPNTPASAGVTYDQLVVTGNLGLGGALQISAVPEVAVAPAPTPAPTAAPVFEPVLARQVFATASNPYVFISAASVTAGSTFASATAPAEVQPLAMLNDGSVLRPLFAVAIPPAPVPLPPAPPAPSPAPVIGTLQQGTTDVVTFLTLFTQQTLLPSPPLFDENGKPKGEPDVVSTDTGTCRPI